MSSPRAAYGVASCVRWPPGRRRSRRPGGDRYWILLAVFIAAQASVAALVGSSFFWMTRFRALSKLPQKLSSCGNLRAGEAGRDRLSELLGDRIADRDRRVGRDVTRRVDEDLLVLGLHHLEGEVDRELGVLLALC